MRIINTEPKIFLGENRIIIKEIRPKEYDSIIKLIKGLGLKRNKKAEKKIREYALKGYKKILSEKSKDKKEISKKLKKHKKEMKNSGLKEGIFECKDHAFHFAYVPKAGFLAGSFKSKKIKIDEFYSLIQSNN